MTDSKNSIATSQTPQEYVGHALDTLKEHFLHKERVTDDFCGGVLAQVATAQTLDDAHRIIRDALKDLGERHSFFLTPAEWNDIQTAAPPEPEGRHLGRMAYLSIPWFGENKHISGEEHAGKIQKLIAQLDTPDILGWIVDLRGNKGGNMWPMLAGLGPLLGDERVGAFQTRGKPDIFWAYKDGGAYADCVREVQAPEETHHRLRGNQPFVAVLIGDQTCSAGEAVAVAFRDRPDTRFFGAATRGVSTSNSQYEMSDGARLVVTTSVFADRLGQAYPKGISPDEVVEGAEDVPLERNPVVQSAMEWLAGKHKPTPEPRLKEHRRLGR
ncbi:MAG: S41 family peptidase [Proteobacteria bacterium]|nr:S41 family peptidase [Pseudomonadota bacterium]